MLCKLKQNGKQVNMNYNFLGWYQVRHPFLIPSIHKFYTGKSPIVIMTKWQLLDKVHMKNDQKFSKSVTSAPTNSTKTCTKSERRLTKTYEMSQTDNDVLCLASHKHTSDNDR